MEHEALQHVAEHEAFYQDPHFWVAVSFVVFIFLALKPVAKILTKTLDGRSAQIAAELEEARRLRVEAQEVLAEYQKKQRDSLQEAEALLAGARADATRLLNKADAELKIALEKRTKMAEAKIAQAESEALQEVQNYVVEVALKATEKLIAERLGAEKGNDELVARVVQDVATKLH